jgi:hypothetical protein
MIRPKIPQKSTVCSVEKSLALFAASIQHRMSNCSDIRGEKSKLFLVDA